MPTQLFERHERLEIRCAVQPTSKLDLYLSFGFSPENPTFGDPGKNAGDLLLIKQEESTRLQISLGKKARLTNETLRKAGGQAGKWMRNNHVLRAGLSVVEILSINGPEGLAAFLEGLRLGVFTFEAYKQSDTTPEPLEVLVINEQDNREIIDLVERVNIVTAAVNLAREWAHHPANIVNPITLADRAQALAQQANLKCFVLDEHDLESLQAGAILAVGRGSKTPSRLIAIEYPGTGVFSDTRPVVLVGKALTFDTGGYSLKSTENIQGMKYDKCGGITVLATLLAAASLQLPIPLVGIVAAAENMISSDAYRPDDIITTLSGKTVEIVTTDAEGRLVLADALTYTQRIYQPRAVIDLATLTGGVVTALGRVRAGIMGNDEALIQRLIASGETTTERLWQLPLDDDYLQQTKGDDADLKNSGGREGHAIMGGIFLKQFVDDAIPWAHLDIAGVADSPKDLPYQPKGATGFGIRLLLDYLNRLT